MHLLCRQPWLPVLTLIHTVLHVSHVMTEVFLIEFFLLWFSQQSNNTCNAIMFYTFEKLNKLCKEKGWNRSLYFRSYRKHECFRERCHLCMCYSIKCILGKNDFNLGQNILNYIKLWNDFNPGKFVLSQVEMTFNVWNSSILFILKSYLLKQICRPQESVDFFWNPLSKFPLSKTMHLMHFFTENIVPTLKKQSEVWFRFTIFIIITIIIFFQVIWKTGSRILGESIFFCGPHLPQPYSREL